MRSLAQKNAPTINQSRVYLFFDRSLIGLRGWVFKKAREQSIFIFSKRIKKREAFLFTGNLGDLHFRHQMILLPPPSLWTPFANQRNATWVTFFDSDRSVASERPRQTRRANWSPTKVARQGDLDRGRPRRVCRAPIWSLIAPGRSNGSYFLKRGTTVNDHFDYWRDSRPVVIAVTHFPRGEIVAHGFAGYACDIQWPSIPSNTPMSATPGEQSCVGICEETAIQFTPVAVGAIIWKSGSAKDEMNVVKNENDLSPLFLHYICLSLESLIEKTHPHGKNRKKSSGI